VSERLRYLAVGAAASLAQMVMMIPSYSEDGFELGSGSVLAVSLVVAALVFVFVVPGGGAVTGVVLGAVALVSGRLPDLPVALPAAGASPVGLGICPPSTADLDERFASSDV
jgi:hypothetical protein